MNEETLYMLEDMAASVSSASNFTSLISLVGYVLSAWAIYVIAQRRGINHPWMAWVPVLNLWTLGSISDRYRQVAMGEVKNKRKVLLALNILNFIVTSAAVIKVIIMIFMVAFGDGAALDEGAFVGQVMSSLMLFIPVTILGIWSLVVEYMALYDLYASCDPKNKTLYLVLSIIPGINQIARPLFLFLCREKDDGMPSVRGTVVENPVEF